MYVHIHAQLYCIAQRPAALHMHRRTVLHHCNTLHPTPKGGLRDWSGIGHWSADYGKRAFSLLAFPGTCVSISATAPQNRYFVKKHMEHVFYSCVIVFEQEQADAPQSSEDETSPGWDPGQRPLFAALAEKRHAGQAPAVGAAAASALAAEAAALPPRPGSSAGAFDVQPQRGTGAQ